MKRAGTFNTSRVFVLGKGQRANDAREGVILLAGDLEKRLEVWCWGKGQFVQRPRPGDDWGCPPVEILIYSVQGA